MTHRNDDRVKFKSNYQVRSTRSSKTGKTIAIVVCAVLLVLIAAAAVLVITGKLGPKKIQTQTETSGEISISSAEGLEATTEDANQTANADGSQETAETEEEKPAGRPLNRSDVKQGLMQLYPWNVTVVNQFDEGEIYHMPNLVESSIDKLVDEIFDGTGKTEFKLTMEIDEELFEEAVKEIQTKWEVPVVNADIVGYDTETDTFTYGEGHDGMVLDTTQLYNDLTDAISAWDYGRVLNAKMDIVSAYFNEEEAAQQYTTLGKCVTNSTSNENRNTNLKLACEAINGTLLKPGDTFSFNLTTGNRTAEKGYKPAGAYTDGGVVVQEEGGGVCQVASTLYNALIRAGFRADERHSHTYEPSYVTPGEDAMVSYDGYNGPDLKFTNTTSSTVVVRANYSNRTVTCFLVGMPFLEEGIEYKLESEKIGENPINVVYQEDPTLEPGTEEVSSEGSAPSAWMTYLITTKDGTEIERERLHKSVYKGHTRVIRRNTGMMEEVVEGESEGESQPFTGNGGFVNSGPGAIKPTEEVTEENVDVDPEEHSSQELEVEELAEYGYPIE